MLFHLCPALRRFLRSYKVLSNIVCSSFIPKFHPNRAINFEHVDRNSFTPLSKVQNFLRPLSRNSYSLFLISPVHHLFRIGRNCRKDAQHLVRKFCNLWLSLRPFYGNQNCSTAFLVQNFTPIGHEM
jgi:hypothetical protein